jgi:hypothetical protein
VLEANGFVNVELRPVPLKYRGQCKSRILLDLLMVG